MVDGNVRGVIELAQGSAALAASSCGNAAWTSPCSSMTQPSVSLMSPVAGALGGILIPIVLERVRADPAVASGTFVTTITDVVGFFSFLGIATLWFGLK